MVESEGSWILLEIRAGASTGRCGVLSGSWRNDSLLGCFGGCAVFSGCLGYSCFVLRTGASTPWFRLRVYGTRRVDRSVLVRVCASKDIFLSLSSRGKCNGCASYIYSSECREGSKCCEMAYKQGYI
jgi:hypothetical protein